MDESVVQEKSITCNAVITDFHGYLDRKNYIAVLVIVGIIGTVLRVLLFPEADEQKFNMTSLTQALLYIIWGFIVYVEICASLKRLNDLQWNKWLVLITLIPVAALIIRIPCVFKKGVLHSKVNNIIENEDCVEK